MQVRTLPYIAFYIIMCHFMVHFDIYQYRPFLDYYDIKQISLYKVNLGKWTLQKAVNVEVITSGDPLTHWAINVLCLLRHSNTEWCYPFRLFFLKP